jgi:RNA polymerase sporulation-specific sigma factor
VSLEVAAMKPPTAPPLAPAPEQLVASVEKLIHQRIQEMAPHLTGQERQDAEQSAREQAWIAAQRYRRSYGTRFTTYAVPYITGGIATYLRGEVRQTKIKQAIRGQGIEYLAEEPDDFDLFHDTDEQLGARLQTAADRQVLAMLLAMGTAPADPESSVAEENDRALARRLVDEVVAAAPASQRAIRELRYRQGRPMKDVEAATGRDERTLRRDHNDLLHALRSRLEAEGITEKPEPAGPEEDDTE